jgi:hypothetical protein
MEKVNRIDKGKARLISLGEGGEGPGLVVFGGKGRRNRMPDSGSSMG